MTLLEDFFAPDDMDRRRRYIRRRVRRAMLFALAGALLLASAALGSAFGNGVSIGVILGSAALGALVGLAVWAFLRLWTITIPIAAVIAVAVTLWPDSSLATSLTSLASEILTFVSSGIVG